jgi:PRTRC genetic system ThiF family protein
VSKLVFDVPDREVEVHVIGAGGTGSSLLGPIAQMALALPKLGHPGINVTVWDDDVVSPANIGRQVFAPSDVGRLKAVALVNRINLSLGLRWEAVPERFTSRRTQGSYSSMPVVLIGAVDSRAARAEIRAAHDNPLRSSSVWIDCGNTASTGQVVLGYRRRNATLAPSAADLFPEIVDVTADATDDQPSCSVAEALAKQDLMTNRKVADEACSLLWQMLRYGELEYHGAFIDARRGRCTPMPVCAAYWASLGWHEPKLPKAA